jgi:hypothetical protein
VPSTLADTSASAKLAKMKMSSLTRLKSSREIIGRNSFVIAAWGRIPQAA